VFDDVGGRLVIVPFVVHCGYYGLPVVRVNTSDRRAAARRYRVWGSLRQFGSGNTAASATDASITAIVTMSQTPLSPPLITHN
jgi:hypothetical protein